MLNRTPLYNAHVKLGGRLVEFGGWEMPVQYSSIIAEHQAVRNAAGLFDISHMGEVFVTGPSAVEFLNRVLTNDVRKLSPGWGQYTLLCLPSGGVVDDLYVFCLAELEYLLIINAARIEADCRWMDQQSQGLFPTGQTLRIHNASPEFGAVAVQGPEVRKFVDVIFAQGTRSDSAASSLANLKKNQITSVQFAGHPAWISRTGYTGEDGFEIVAPAAVTEALWNRTLEAGLPFGLKPAGLGARDTLRTEAGYPLYGHELTDQTTPIEAGLARFVAMEKTKFNGREVLADQLAHGVRRTNIAFRMADKTAPPRPEYAVWNEGSVAERIGVVTSGTQSPSLGVGIGMAYVPPTFAAPNTAIQIEIRGRRTPAVVVPKPIFRKPKTR